VAESPAASPGPAPVPPPAPARAPAAADELPARPGTRSIAIAGLLVVAAFFGGFGVWGALAPLESAAIAPGVVQVDTRRKTIKHLEGGIVEEILVRDGDHVAAGQVLVRLDDTQARATLDLLHGRWSAMRARESRLVAERDGLDEVPFPAELLAEHDDPDVAEHVEAQSRIFHARRASLEAQRAILGQRIAQYAEEIRGVEGKIASDERRYAIIREEVADLESLFDKGLVDKARMLALKRAQAEIEGERSENLARIARARQNIKEAELRITTLETELVREAVEGLREVRGELFDLEQRMRAARDVLARTEIRAPQEGTVVGTQVHTTGGVVGSGEALMDIVPAGDRLVIEARVDPTDIDVVHEGLAAKVRLTAYSQRRLRPLEARVAWVSADRMEDRRTGAGYFLTRLELTEDPAALLEGATVNPGMSAEVMIITGQQTPVEYLLKPLTATFRRALREE